MTSDSSLQVHDFSSSGPVAVSVRYKETLDLGSKLVNELGLEQSVDTLGRWMAHYIAELIQDAEKASVDDRTAKMGICCDAIINLWKHRHTLPDGSRPFEEIEPHLRALESLDPENDKPRYYRTIRATIDESKENDESKYWLKFIDGLDHSAKILIRYGLIQGAHDSLNKFADWVNLAEAAGAGDGIEFNLFHSIFEENNLLKSPNPIERENKKLEDRIEKLEAFAKMAISVASDLRNCIHHTAGDGA